MPPVTWPASLSNGDEIRIVAPASVVEEEYVHNAAKALSDMGYHVTYGKLVFTTDNQYAGTDAQRLSDFQEALDDRKVKAIFCARGGYGSIRIVNRLDFTVFRKEPKWIVGFSDITVFHSLLNCHFNVPSIHSPMPVNFGSPFFAAGLEALDQLLKGERSGMEFDANPMNRSGEAMGKLVGGNLSLLINLQSTPFEIITRGAVLFIEDVGEQLYHLDRMMRNLLLSGKLNGLKGLIVGGMTEMSDKKRPFGKTPDEIVLDAVKDFNYPVAFSFPAGHMENNRPFLLGTTVELSAGPSKTEIKYSHKAY
jgi:muramoyltetrapeptide carboxypeptidase